MSSELKEFKNKVVLITGSSTGIGRSTALGFAKEGAKVVVNCVRSVKKAESVVQKIRKSGGEAIFVRGDVSMEDQVDKMIQAVLKEFGRIDILVNNAGIAKQNNLFELSVEDFRKTLDVNLLGTFLCIKYAARAMLKNKPDKHSIRGKIVNVASIRGLENCARKDLLDYSAAKAGVISLTKSLAKELTPEGININAVAPAITKTELVKNLTQEARKRAVQDSIIKRMAEPEEIAAGILFLASEGANYMTGEVMVIDGGYNLTRL